ncbi:MAG: hypothetical protein KC416_11685, partial [Myxococcales bacterium]|nr:hypothetical protein [Myxococcales bacterium]
MIVRPNLALLLLALPLFAGCNDDPEPTLAQGIFAPLGDPLPSASATALEAFERGRAVSMRRFTSTDGLGPRFNVTSCGACHEKPTMGGGAARYRNFLLVGERLEDGSFVSTGTNGIQAHYTLDERNRFPDEASANNLALRNPIPFFGVGLLAEIPEGEILKRSDPNDKDGDGISGRPNFDRGFVGRFGRKAQTVSIEGFIRGPLFNHAGITTNPLSDDLRAMLPIPPPSDSNIGISGGALRASDVDYVTATQAAAPDEPTLDEDDVPDPELGGSDLFDLVAFTMLLAAPAPSEPTPESLRGEKLFESLACTSCHVPFFVDARAPTAIYTDLLLHDMGDA